MTSLTVLLVAVVATLIWLGLKLQRLIGLLSLAIRAVQPIDDVDLEDANSHLRDWLEHGPRTVLDQLLAVSWMRSRALRRSLRE